MMSPLFLCFILLFVFPAHIHSRQIHENHSNSSHNRANCIEAERQILVSFKRGLQDPAGLLSSWHGRDCCTWSGISCSKRTGQVIKLDLRGTCDVDDFGAAGDDVYYVEFAGNNQSLKGKLNPSLFNLKFLQYLDLSCNDFEGSTLPSSIGSMGSLRYLNLSVSNFFGMVPPHLGNLSKLLYLDLQAFHTLKIDTFSGYCDTSNISVADLNWLSRLSLLRYLNLGFVNLSSASNGWLRATNALSSIEELHFRCCQLHDLPQSASVSNFTSLSVLNLVGNHFNASLPRWLLNITTLSHLRLQAAEIKLSLNNTIAWKHLCNLKSLDISFNYGITGHQVTGFIDSLAECSNGSMEELNLSRLKLQGHLPESLGQLRSLRYLLLRGNSISGPVPTSIGNLSHLTQLDMSSNKFNGTLPETIGQLEELVELDLRGNNWEFMISETHFLHLKNLKSFYLTCMNDKSLNFDVSPNWVPRFSLTSLSIERCKMDPWFPVWLKTQTHLTSLLLQNVGISGEIPSWFWKLISPQLTELSLSNNQLSGKLPKTLILKNLFTFNLSRNKLSGKIPQFKGLGFVAEMDLSKNHLIGKIPQSLCSTLQLDLLILNNNNLSGNLAALRNCTTLTELRLADNRFSGNIPRWIGDMTPDLTILSLRGNSFTGIIQENLCQLPRLHILDLGYNNLTGTIPSCIGNLTTLTENGYSYLSNVGSEMDLSGKGRMLNYSKTQVDSMNIIDLSRNNLKGAIPEGLANLTRLITLNLSHNQLTGNLPEKIGCLTQLETLDLSSNHLSGPIPTSITSLTFLNHFNVSHNNLSGPIPVSNQFLTFTDDPSIYEGNSYLCGSTPWLKSCSTADHTDKMNPQGSEGIYEEDENYLDMLWLNLGLVCGIVVGFWAFCGSLAISKSWRHQIYQFLEKASDRILPRFSEA